MITQFSRLSKVNSVLILVFMPLVVQAACPACAELIWLKESQVKCFDQQYENFLEEISATPRGRTAIDFNVCDGGSQDANRSLAGLPNITTSSNSSLTERELKSVYLLDVDSLICLKDLISSHKAGFDPAVKFDLFEMCPNG